MSGTGSEVWVVRLGTVPYAEAVTLQKRLEEARQADEIPDVLLLLEHPPVFTKGRRTEPGHLPMGEDWYRMQGIEVCDTDRGGQVTYHGPGQLVAYPVIQLPVGSSASRPGPTGSGHARVDVVDYVRRLETVMIAALGDYGVPAQIFDGLTGVWTAGDPPIASGELGPQRTPVGAPELPGGEARKIGSIGIHVNKGVTTHGLAVNVNNDLQPFEWVVPCAIEGVRMTSLCRELGAEQDLDAFGSAIRDRFAEAFAARPVEIEPAALEPAPAA
jgi:lipoyl(octanoyl) transferase